MAGGAIAPISAVPVTAGDAFPMVYDGGGTPSVPTTMYGISDATAMTAGDHTLWHLVFKTPEVLPTGQATFIVSARCPATSGTLALNIQWLSVGLTEDPDIASFFDETSLDITMPTTTDQYKEGTVDLDADTPVAGEYIHVLVEVDDSEHNVASDVGCFFLIDWR